MGVGDKEPNIVSSPELKPGPHEDCQQDTDEVILSTFYAPELAPDIDPAQQTSLQRAEEGIRQGIGNPEGIFAPQALERAKSAFSLGAMSYLPQSARSMWRISPLFLCIW